MRIILASNSPRRASIMQLANIDFEVIKSDFDESSIKESDIEKLSEELAYQKAFKVYDNTQGDRAVIGSDTLVVKDGKIFGKPKDRLDAIKMLKSIQGGEHTVYTSVAILIEDRGRESEYKEVVKTDIVVNPMTDEEISEYIDLEEPYDKAGAYAIQSSFCKYIDVISGNYMGVVGLPIDRIYKVLKDYGVL